MTPATTLLRREGGQALAIFAIAGVALLAMVALIIDGGVAFQQQRQAQNGADAASEAGAVVLMQRLAGVVPAKTGTDVYNAVQDTASANGLNTPVQGCYTDLDGNPLNSDGTLATDCTSAAQIGVGLAIPPCATCPGLVAAGVRVSGSRPFDTFFAGIVGIHDFTAAATATARSGYVTAISTNVVPVTFPVFATGCDDTGEAIPGSTTPWPVGPDNVLAIPLCKDSQGNVGWLDWTPPFGGTSELADAIIPPPGNPPIHTPHWYYITAPGNTNASTVQTAMEHWIGTNILLPIFNESCDDTPANLENLVGLLSDCADGGGSLGGHGTNTWYFLVGFAAFHLEQVFINAPDGGVCDAYYPDLIPGGNGGTSCLIGYFVGPSEAVSIGASVGAGGGSDTSTSIVGVQLIR